MQVAHRALIGSNKELKGLKMTMSNCFTHQANEYVLLKARIVVVQSLARQTHPYIL